MRTDRATATATFITSFAQLHGRVHGSTLTQIAGLPCVRFGQPVEGRSEEFFAHDIDPALAHALAHAAARSPGYWITAIDPLEVSSAARYTALGYQFAGLEWLMELPLRSLAPPSLSAQAQVIRDPTVVAQINAASGRAVFPTSDLDRPDLTIAVVRDGPTPVAWGGQIWADPARPYVTHIRTQEAHRKRGFAMAVMQALLHEALVRGAQASVLVATAEGRPLYQRLGYQDLAHVRIWRSPN